MGWSAFVAGALIGAGVALLFAPRDRNGVAGILRNYAARAKDEAMERGKAAWDTAVERGRDYYEKGQDTVQEAGRSAVISRSPRRSPSVEDPGNLLTRG